MIEGQEEIFTKAEKAMHEAIREYHEAVLNADNTDKLTINSIEDMMLKAMNRFKSALLEASGEYLSNIDNEETKETCKCNREMRRAKKKQKITITSCLGKITIKRDEYFCRHCHTGHGIIDKKLELAEEHRVTKRMTERITYIAQLVPSFERAAEALNKLTEIEICATQMQIISEEVGKEVFEKDMVEAKEAYAKPEISAPQALEKDKKEGVLYILVDGSAVNTRKSENGTTWKEMKLGLIFCDKNTIKIGKNNIKITKKEYVSYFGGVEEFKKLLFAAAIRAGYGKIKEVVILGDGAQWIWNMCNELFPDAVTILDFFHLSENIHEYARFLYHEDEIKRKRWVDDVITAVKEGKVDEAISLVEAKKVDTPPVGVVNLYKYMTNNKDRINYKSYEEKGYYIGSGAIESGNKTVIQQRMKQSGMRWGMAGGQYIAALRAKYESNMWDEIQAAVGM